VTVSGTRPHGVITQNKTAWTASFANKQVVTSSCSVACCRVSLIQSAQPKPTASAAVKETAHVFHDEPLWATVKQLQALFLTLASLIGLSELRGNSLQGPKHVADYLWATETGAFCLF